MRGLLPDIKNTITNKKQLTTISNKPDSESKKDPKRSVKKASNNFEEILKSLSRYRANLDSKQLSPLKATRPKTTIPSQVCI